MKTLVLANQKGGVGKSAVATLLAHLFRQRGLRVLAIDLDHQGNFSEPVRKSQRAARAEVPASGVLVQRNPVIPPADFVLVAADLELSGLERQAEGFVLWEMKKTAARDAWREIEPGLTFIANTVLSPNPRPAVTHPLNGASHGPVAR